MILKRSYIALVFLFLVTGVAFGQHLSHNNNAGGFVRFKKKKRYWSVGPTLMAMNYVGDLDPAENLVSPALRYTRPSFGAVLTYRYSPRFTFRGAFSWGRIKGDDKVSDPDGRDQFRRMRNSNFRNTILELKFDAMYDLRKNLGDYTKRPKKVIPYLFLGVAGFYHNPKAEINGEWVALQPLQTEGKKYSKFQVAVPFGIGVRLYLTSNLDLSFEIGWRKTFTSYLDDVSGTYVDPKTQSVQSATLANRSVDWIDQPANPSALANASKAELAQYIKPGAPEIAYERIYYNEQTGRLEFWGWGQADFQRGNKKADWYILTGFKLTYIIGGRIVCPKFRD
jgi:hypothetical protein